MKEWVCINLTRTDGEPKGKDTPPVRATAICLANEEHECPKTRAKFRITPLCFRIRNTQVRKEDN